MKPIHIFMYVFFIAFASGISTGVVDAHPNQYKVKEQAAFVADFEFSLPAALVGEQSSNNNVQVFDVQKGKVVFTAKNNDQFQKFAHGWISGIKEFAPEVQPDMKASYIFRIPLVPPVSLQVGSTELQVTEIFMFYYKDKEPLLLIFDQDKKPYLFHTSNDVTPFIQYISIPD